MLISFSILAVSCGSLPKASDMKVIEASLGTSELDKADKLDSSSGTTERASLMYQDAHDDERVLSGLVSEIGVSATQCDARTAGVDVDLDRASIDLGLRYYADTGTRFLQPYISLGVSPTYLRAQTDIGEDKSSFALAGYVGVGVEAALGSRGRLGVGYRHSIGSSFDIGDDKDVDMNEGTLSVSFGWGF